MRALQVTRLDGPRAMELVELPEPAADGAVLVDVAAAGVAFPDLLLTRGRYQMKPELPFTPGVEVAGVVRSAPAGAGVAAGDRVAAFMGLGGFAEVVAVQPSQIVAIPDGLSFAAASGLVMNYHTAHFALHRRGQLRAGEVLLVHGAAGGVGTAAVQLGTAAGARVLATASTPQKAELVRSLGAEQVLATDGDWAAEVRAATGGRGADVIFDPVGGDRFDASVRCLAPEGRLLVIGFAEGRIPTVAVNRLLLRNVSVVGVGWGAFLAVDPTLTATISADLDRLLASGAVAPVVGATFPMEEGAAALEALESRRALGKVVLRVRPDLGD